MTPSSTVLGDSFRCVAAGVDAAGKPTHYEWTGKFDRKDYPVVGDPTAATRSLRLVKPGHYTLINKKAGKPVITGTLEFSAHNTSRTLTTHMTDAAGNN